MKTIPIYQIDAFASSLFTGNPAAVCPLDDWLPAETMQSIATENNLSETAFLVKKNGEFQVRWFTPAIEVDLCGHATLAAAHVIFSYLEPNSGPLSFQSNSGKLTVTQDGDMITLDFPADPVVIAVPPPGLIEALNMETVEVYQGKTDYMVVAPEQTMIEKAKPNFSLLSKVNARGVIITASGEEVDFVSRFFAPASGINEDPVTGSAHCTLTPYWAEATGKNKLTAHQLSGRGGQLICELVKDRVKISGKAITYMTGNISLPTA